MNRYFWATITLLMFFIIASCSFSDFKQAEKEDQRMITEVLPSRYNKGLSDLKKGRYEEAAQQLIPFNGDNKRKAVASFINSTYPNGKYLYEYSQAKFYDRKAEFNIVGSFINKIPDTYQGEFAEDILKMKKQDWAKKASDKINMMIENSKVIANNQGVNIGANKRSVINEWGNPNKINKTETANGIREQWVYDNSYVYFVNGEVVAIQN